MANRIAGIAFLKIDGDMKELRGSFTVSPSATERTGIAGQDGVHGFSEMPRVPFIEGDLSTTAGLSIEDLDAIEDATVQADLANGKSYVLRNAWCKAGHSINTAEGQVSVRFEGYSCDEIS